MNCRNIHIIQLGLTHYKPTWDLQQKIFDLRVSDKISDVLILNEHNHVYTLGKSSDENHLLANESELKATGAAVFHIDRGGDITYHGPGQLVAYPILKLSEYYEDAHRYLRDLEEVIIRCLAEYGIIAHRDANFTGVWVGNDKIAAMGVKVSHWVTMHGFAFNVNTNLSYFDRIIPCGIFHKGVTSMQRLLGRQISMVEISQKIVDSFCTVFEVRPTEINAEEFHHSLPHPYLEVTECLQ